MIREGASQFSKNGREMLGEEGLMLSARKGASQGCIGRLRESCDPHPVLPAEWGRRILSIYEYANFIEGQSESVGCAGSRLPPANAMRERERLVRAVKSTMGVQYGK
jgi:hypothetical protein